MIDFQESDHIIVQRDGPATVIRLNRPAKYNALNRELLRALELAIRAQTDDDDVRAIILTGTDDYFSTGADLNEALLIDSPAASLRYQRIWRELDLAMERCPKPIIAAIGGHCITGGFELALACDLRVGASNSSFAVTSPRIGSVAGMGATQRLPRLIGPAFAKELLLLSETIDAEAAYRMGILNRLVPEGRALDEALAMATRLAELAPLSVAWHKLAVNAGMECDLQAGLDLEASLSSQAFGTADKQEGMSAFLEKRTAVFRGR